MNRLSPWTVIIQSPGCRGLGRTPWPVTIEVIDSTAKVAAPTSIVGGAGAGIEDRGTMVLQEWQPQHQHVVSNNQALLSAWRCGYPRSMSRCPASWRSPASSMLQVARVRMRIRRPSEQLGSIIRSTGRPRASSRRCWAFAPRARRSRSAAISARSVYTSASLSSVPC
jgi:hypothetical protein